MMHGDPASSSAKRGTAPSRVERWVRQDQTANFLHDATLVLRVRVPMERSAVSTALLDLQRRVDLLQDSNDELRSRLSTADSLRGREISHARALAAALAAVAPHRDGDGLAAVVDDQSFQGGGLSLALERCQMMVNALVKERVDLRQRVQSAEVSARNGESLAHRLRSELVACENRRESLESELQNMREALAAAQRDSEMAREEAIRAEIARRDSQSSLESAQKGVADAGAAVADAVAASTAMEERVQVAEKHASKMEQTATSAMAEAESLKKDLKRVMIRLRKCDESRQASVKSGAITLGAALKECEAYRKALTEMANLDNFRIAATQSTAGCSDGDNVEVEKEKEAVTRPRRSARGTAPQQTNQALQLPKLPDEELRWLQRVLQQEVLQARRLHGAAVEAVRTGRCESGASVSDIAANLSRTADAVLLSEQKVQFINRALENVLKAVPWLPLTMSSVRHTMSSSSKVKPKPRRSRGR